MLVTDTYVKMPSYRKINAIPESSCPAGSHRSKSCNCHNRGKESGRFSVHWTYALNICFEHLLWTFASDICFEHNFPDCVSCNSLNLIQYCYGYGHRTTEFLLDFFKTFATPRKIWILSRKKFQVTHGHKQSNAMDNQCPLSCWKRHATILNMYQTGGR